MLRRGTKGKIREERRRNILTSTVGGEELGRRKNKRGKCYKKTGF